MLSFVLVHTHDNSLEVGRVVWFRQEAKVARWCEEVQLLQQEIYRSKQFFRNRAALWRSQVELKLRDLPTFGKNIYCLKRAAMYDRLLGTLCLVLCYSVKK